MPKVDINRQKPPSFEQPIDRNRPDLSRPDISRPDIRRPDLSRPDLSRPDLGRPDLSRPDLSRPDLSRPDLGRPDSSRPDLSRPDLSRPDLSRPDLGRPDLSRPDLSRPDLSRPDLSRPDIRRPDSSRPDVSSRPVGVDVFKKPQDVISQPPRIDDINKIKSQQPDLTKTEPVYAGEPDRTDKHKLPPSTHVDDVNRIKQPKPTQFGDRPEYKHPAVDHKPSTSSPVDHDIYNPPEYKSKPDRTEPDVFGRRPDFRQSIPTTVDQTTPGYKPTTNDGRQPSIGDHRNDLDEMTPIIHEKQPTINDRKPMPSLDHVNEPDYPTIQEHRPQTKPNRTTDRPSLSYPDNRQQPIKPDLLHPNYNKPKLPSYITESPFGGDNMRPFKGKFV